MTLTPTVDQEELVRQLKAKNKATFGVLYDNYAGAIYGLIHRIVIDNKIAEEVLQDAFMKYWDRMDHYDPTKGRLYTWMANIARNMAIDKIRSKEIKKAQKTGDLSNFVTDIERSGQIHQQIDSIGLKDALKSLREEEEFILEMAYFKGYTQSEITAEFGIPLGTVKTRLRMAIKNLRSVLNIE